MNLSKIAAALRVLADAVDETADESPAPAKRSRKAAAAPESVPAVATPAAPAATAPAAAQPPAQSPPAPTPSPAPAMDVKVLNGMVLKLAAKSAGSDGITGRDKALAILGKYGASNTPGLKPEHYQAVYDSAEEEIAKMDAAATQVSLV